MAAIRIVPKVTSTFRMPPDPDSADASVREFGIPPIVFPPPHDDETVPASAVPGEPEILLLSTREFVKDQMRQPVLETDVFHPREPRYARLRLFFEERSAPDSPHPVLGPIGDLFMEGHFDENNDGIFETVTPRTAIASALTNVSFLVYNDNRRVRLRVEARGLRKNATSNGVGEETVERALYETDIFLPVYTNTAGGG